MTRPVPVAIPDPLLPLADPTDRARFAERKLEHLRWERQNLSPGALALAQVALDNATDANVSATSASASAVSTAANTALAALYAGAPLWVSGTTYGLSVLARSPANGRIYNKITGTAGGAVDPSVNATDWSPVPIATPIQVVTGLVQQAISGGAYAATNVTAQAAATNLLLYSSQFDQATWGKSSATVTADATMSPTGKVDADKIVEAAATAAHYLTQVLSIASNVPYAFSVIAKAAGRTSMSLQADDGGINCVRAKIDLTTGAVTAVVNQGTGTGAAGAATYLGYGWWLCTLSGTCSSVNSGLVGGRIGIIDFASNVGDGVSGIYVAQAQVETGSVATSRIDTVAGQVTRAASVVAPQRFIAPATPAADAFFQVSVQNGVDTNVVDLNGATFYGQSGIVSLDNAYLTYKFQSVNGTWRFV